MFERYDILTIYDFYNELEKKINELINYCIKNCNDSKVIEGLIDIGVDYSRLVMKEFESTYLFNEEEDL